MAPPHSRVHWTAGRWLEIMQEFDFDIEHHAGTKHVNADALSRRVDVVPTETPSADPIDWRAEQAKDPNSVTSSNLNQFSKFLHC